MRPRSTALPHSIQAPPSVVPFAYESKTHPLDLYKIFLLQETRTDDSDGIAPLSEAHKEQAIVNGPANEDLSPLGLGVIRIVEYRCQRIVETGCRLRERHVMGRFV
jgi:hypothetical protein